jgi:predicted ester cyclase
MKYRNFLLVIVLFAAMLILLVPISAQDSDMAEFVFDDPDLQARADLALAYVGCLNAGDIECLFEILSPDMTSVTPLVPGIVEGRDNFIEIISPIFAAFPNGVNIAVTDLVMGIDGETVLTRHFVSATHEGTLLGIPATGRDVVWTEWDAFSFVTDDEGRLWINNVTAEANFLGVIIQIGGLGAAPTDE